MARADQTMQTNEGERERERERSLKVVHIQFERRFEHFAVNLSKDKSTLFDEECRISA